MITTAIAAGVVLAGITPASTGASIAVAPLRIEVHASARPVTRWFRVENAGKTPLRVGTAVVAGTMKRDGSSVFTPPGPGSGAAWVTVTPRTLVLRRHQTGRVRVVVAVPPRQAGQRYLGVFFYTTRRVRLRKTGATVAAGIDAAMIIDTTGTVHRSAGYSLHAPSWSFGGAVPVTLTVANRGNVYGLLNHLTARSGGSSARFPGVLVLAGATRTVTTMWDAPAWCLPCHLTGPGRSAAVVWRLPLLPLSGGVLGVAGGAGTVIMWRRRGRRRYARARHPARDTGPGLVS